MSIYNKSGGQLSAVYNVDGLPMQNAYDVNGVIVFQKGLKIMSYNVGGWYIGSGTNVPSDKDETFYVLQNGMIEAVNADILCIQEFWTIFSQSGRTAASMLSQYYPHIRTSDGDTDYLGRAICSKYPITSYTKHTYSGESRYYDCAVINVGGISISVFVTHLHPSNAATKIAEATELCNYIQSQGLTNYIICGDFNSTLYDPFSQTNAAIYNQFLAEGCSLANGGSFGILATACNSANWADDKFAIDNIIVSGAFELESVSTNLAKITNSAVLETGKIDHVPLYATIEI